MNQNLTLLSNEELIESLKNICRKETAATCEVLLHLIEVDNRRLYAELGYSSLFDYCLRALFYSESGAGRRVQAARALRDYPQILPLLKERRLSLATLSQVAGSLTKDNADEFLSRVAGRSKREVDEFLAEGKPVAQIRERVRPLFVKGRPEAGSENPCRTDAPTGGSAGSDESRPEAMDAPAEKVYQVSFAVPESVMEKLKIAQALSSRGHKISELFEVLLDQYLERNSAKRKIAQKPVRSRHIPKAVREEVFARDGHRCSYVAPDGTRCTKTVGLQIDHVRPFALGGDRDASNTRLLCPCHNRMMADQVFGPEFIKGRIAGSSRRALGDGV